MTITVKYSCDKCGLNKVSCEVPARTVEGPIYWFENVLSPVLSRDHDRRSPKCKIDKLTEVMIPITGVNRIGGPKVN